MAWFILSSRNVAKYFPSNNFIKRIFTCKTTTMFQKKDQAGLKKLQEEKIPCAKSVKHQAVCDKIVSNEKPSESVGFKSYTDLKVPDFNFYRRKATLDPCQPSRKTLDDRRGSTALAYLAGGLTGLYASKTVVHEFVASMAITQDMLALARIEVNLNSIPEGRTVSIKWRGKPVFIWHRNQESIDLARSVDMSVLRDPEKDEDRFSRPEWLVVIGVCTHLGCVPLANSGDYGGFYCPCHGTHYDSSGRVRKGPAPLNLAIPDYEFIGDEDQLTMIIG